MELLGILKDTEIKEHCIKVSTSDLILFSS